MRAPKFWRRHFLQWELALSVVVALGFWVWCARYGGADQINRIKPDARNDFYGAASSIFGVLLGFALTAISINLGLVSDKRLEFLRESPMYPQFWEVFLSTMRWLAIATVWSVICLVLDTGKESSLPLVSLLVAFGLTAAFRFYRTVWVFESIVKVVTKPHPNTTSRPVRQGVPHSPAAS